MTSDNGDDIARMKSEAAAFFGSAPGVFIINYTDEYISSKLCEIGKTGFKAAPIEGTWQTPPYQEVVVNQRSGALIIKDAVFIVVVDRADGAVMIIDSDNNTSLINASLDQFCRCAIHWGKLLDVPENISKREREEIAALFTKDLLQIDKMAFENENQLWPVAIEEFSYGM